MKSPNTIDYYEFLVNLRNSGITNMFGASVYLEDTFNLSPQEAKSVLANWMRSFNLPKVKQPQDGR